MPRHKKPAQIRLLDGRLNKNTVENIENYIGEDDGGNIPDCPDELTDDAKIEWNRIIPLLEVRGLVSKISRAALAGYCSNWAVWVESQRHLKEEGQVIQVLDGEVRRKLNRPDVSDECKQETVHYYIAKKNPWADIARDAAKAYLRFMVEFGGTPASWERAHREEKSKSSAKQRFFK